MSRATTGEFGGKKPPVVDGIVSFSVRRVDGGYRCVGGEPDFDGVGEAPTAALAVADYCQKYHDSTAGESEEEGSR